MKRNFNPISLVFFSCLLFLSSAAVSQTYEFLPGTTVTEVFHKNELFIVHIGVKNTGSSDLDLSWETIRNGLDSTGWDYSMCDVANCYIPPIPTSQNPPAVPAGQTRSFSLNIDPKGHQTAAVYQIYVYPTMDHSAGDTLTFIVDGTHLGIQEDKMAAEVSLYPNPVKETVSLDLTGTGFTPAHIVVYNVTGQQVAAYETNKAKVDVSTLPAGIYTLTAMDKTGRYFSKRFTKAE